MIGVDVTKRSIGVNVRENGEAEVIVWSPTANTMELKMVEYN